MSLVSKSPQFGTRIQSQINFTNSKPTTSSNSKFQMIRIDKSVEIRRNTKTSSSKLNAYTGDTNVHQATKSNLIAQMPRPGTGSSNVNNPLSKSTSLNSTKLSDRFSYSVSPNKALAKGNLKKYLPDQTADKIGKKTLVLDLDETLVHSAFQPFNRSADINLKIELEGKIHDIFVLKRYGVEEFLQKMSKIYEIVVFTASLSKYAEPLISILDPNGHCNYSLFREHCTMINNAYVKDLKYLNRDLKDLIINNPASFALNVENGIPIKSWYEDKNDRELINLIPILEFLSNVVDVRDYVKQVVNGSEISIKKFNNLLNRSSTINQRGDKQGQEFNNMVILNTPSNQYVSSSNSNKKLPQTVFNSNYNNNLKNNKNSINPVITGIYEGNINTRDSRIDRDTANLNINSPISQTNNLKVIHYNDNSMANSQKKEKKNLFLAKEEKVEFKKGFKSNYNPNNEVPTTIKNADSNNIEKDEKGEKSTPLKKIFNPLSHSLEKQGKANYSNLGNKIEGIKSVKAEPINRNHSSNSLNKKEKASLLRNNSNVSKKSENSFIPSSNRSSKSNNKFGIGMNPLTNSSEIRNSKFVSSSTKNTVKNTNNEDANPSFSSQVIKSNISSPSINSNKNIQNRNITEKKTTSSSSRVGYSSYLTNTKAVNANNI